MTRSFPYIAFAVLFTAFLIWFAWASYRAETRGIGVEAPVDISRLYARDDGTVRERGIAAVR